jgi:hypothetical protein
MGPGRMLKYAFSLSLAYARGSVTISDSIRTVVIATTLAVSAYGQGSSDWPMFGLNSRRRQVIKLLGEILVIDRVAKSSEH